jgi:hypothetical protein
MGSMGCSDNKFRGRGPQRRPPVGEGALAGPGEAGGVALQRLGVANAEMAGYRYGSEWEWDWRRWRGALLQDFERVLASNARQRLAAAHRRLAKRCRALPVAVTGAGE